jgi:hypothetical protein
VQVEASGDGFVTSGVPLDGDAVPPSDTGMGDVGSALDDACGAPAPASGLLAVHARTKVAMASGTTVASESLLALERRKRTRAAYQVPPGRPLTSRLTKLVGSP